MELKNLANIEPPNNNLTELIKGMIVAEKILSLKKPENDLKRSFSRVVSNSQVSRLTA